MSFEMNKVNQLNNHLSLDIKITTFKNLIRIVELLRERHREKNDMFGFIKDKVTFIIRRNVSDELSIYGIREL